MKRRLLLLITFLMTLQYTPIVHATYYDYTANCVVDENGNLVQEDDVITENKEYIIVGKTFERIDENSNTTFCIGEFIGKEMTKTTYNLTPTAILDSHIEKVSDDYTSSTGNLIARQCSNSSWHEHKWSLNVPSNVTVTNISVSYYNANYGGSALLQISSDGSEWKTIASGNHYNANTFYASIDTSTRYIRVVHEKGQPWSVIYDVAVSGEKNSREETIIDGYHLSENSLSTDLSEAIVENVIVTSNNTHYVTSNIDSEIWNISTNEKTLTLTPKDSSIGSVTKEQVSEVINAIKWTGTIDPEPSITINTLG